MSDTVTDADPAIVACASVAEFAEAMRAYPDAIDVDATTWLANRCTDPEATELPATAICEELATVTTSTAADTTAAPATTVAATDFKADCMAYIPIGAFSGDPKASDLWAFIGQDSAQLSSLCEQLTTSEPATAEAFSNALAAHNASIATAPPTTTTAAPTTAPPTTTPPTTAPAPTVPPAPPPPTAGMPNVLCMNLQDAQDLIQAVTGVFYSRSFDATGDDRSQLVDSNWLVVSQDPEPGTPIGEGDAVLGAVKYGETALC